MSCSALEQDVALYVEGDLPESELVRVQTHIQGCANCGNLANELRQSQTVLKALRQNSVSSAALAEVRQRVMVEVGDSEPAPAWVLMIHRMIFAGLRRRTAIAGLVLVTLVSGGVWYEQTRFVIQPTSESPVEVARFEVPAERPTVSKPRPPALAPRTVEPVEPLEELSAEFPVAQSVETPAPLDSQVSQIPMKFVTDDPDIIIYWLPSDKGD